MFQPRYQLNQALLNNIVRIKNVISAMNDQRFSDIVLAKFEKDSYAVSAHASTSIEGNPIPLTDVRKLLKSAPAHVRDTEREILNYNKALHHLNSELKKGTLVTKQFMCAVQAMVVDGLIDAGDIGTYRRAPVVVNNPKNRQIAFIPPDAKDVPELVDELVVFLGKEHNSTDPLILAGIFHKQFVIIHPFMDGNGRTTRLVTKYILARMGLDTFQLFSFENYYNQNVSHYFSKVGVLGDCYEMRDNIDFTDWLIYFTDGIIDELLRVQAFLVASLAPVRLAEHEKKILAYIKKHGSITKSEYDTITNRARSTQILDFKRLTEKGLVVKQGKAKATFYTLANE